MARGTRFSSGFWRLRFSTGFWGSGRAWTGPVPCYEIWTNFPFAGGQLLASHPKLQDPRIVFDLQGPSGGEQLTFKYPLSSEAAAHNLEGRVLCRRVARKTIQGTNRTSYWLITRAVDRTNGWADCVAEPASSILADYPVEEIVSTGFPNGDIAQADSTPEEHVRGSLLPSLPGWINLGTMEPTERFQFGQADVTALDWVIVFAKEIGCEWRLRVLDDESGMVLDFESRIGIAAPKVYVETGKNIAAIERTRDYKESATHVRGYDGNGVGLWYNAWALDTILTGGNWGDVNASGTITIVDAQQVGRYAAGLSVTNLNALIQRGDVNGDGRIDLDDATELARYAVSLGPINPIAARIGTACTFTLFKLLDPLGRLSIDAVPFDGSLDNHYLTKDQVAYDDQVVALSFAPCFALVEDATGFSEDDTVVIRETSGTSGERLRELTNPFAITDRRIRFRRVRIRRTNITALRNMVDNAFMREYADPDGAPDGWTFTDVEGGVTIARSTDDALYGGYSARMTFTSPSGFTPCHFKLLSNLIPPWEVGPDGRVCIKFRVTVTSFTITVDGWETGPLCHLGLTDDTDEFVVIPPIPITEPGTYEFSIKGVDPSLFPDGYKVGLIYNDPRTVAFTSVDLSVDVFQATQGADDPQVFLEGPESNLLYNTVGKCLVARNPGVYSLVIELRDLVRGWQTQHPEDELTIGGLVGFIAPVLALAEDIRIVRYELLDAQPLNSVIHVATRRQRLVDTLAKAADASIKIDLGGLSQALAKEIGKTTFTSNLPAIKVFVRDGDGVETDHTAEIPPQDWANATKESLARTGKRLLTPGLT